LDIKELLKTEEKKDRMLTIHPTGEFLTKEQWDKAFDYFEAKKVFIYYNEEANKIVLSIDEDEESGEEHKTE